MINLSNINGFNDIQSIQLKKKLPQVGSYIINYEYNDGFVIPNEYEDKWIDFIICENGDLILGKGHYKISKKSGIVKFAGRLKIKDKKIIDIDGDSGHYIPNEIQIENIKKFLIK